MCRFVTRTPMLVKADFASWQQRIRLYCRGKDNGINILKSIDEGPFQMGTTRGIIDEGTEGPINLGETIHSYYVRFAKLINDMRNIKMTMSKIQLNSKFVNNMLPEWGRFVTAVKLNKGLKDSNFDQLYAYLKQHEAHANENKMMLERLTQQTVDPLALMVIVQNVQGRQNRGQGNSARGAGAVGYGRAPRKSVGMLIGSKLGRLTTEPVQDLALNVDNVFQADDCDAYDSDVDDAPTAQTLFMANLSSADPVYDEAGPSYDSDVLSEYVKDNEVPVVQNNASMVPNDAYVMIDNDLHDSDVRSVSHTPRNTVANNLLNAELATYKEQVELYERRARFELTEREQKIDEQNKES
ncbi:hypothetical protein Tco_0810323 [Tanacetum coccineum]